jgi:pyrroline-5-carboxylate reductase
VSREICFIGAGNMATSLIGGMIAKQQGSAGITACDIDAGQLRSLRERFGISVSQDNLAAAAGADVVMLAVKPQVMREVCTALSSLPSNPAQLFISVAAGVPAAAIENWLGGERAIVRCMPNTPALLQLGASGLAANSKVSAAQKEIASEIMQSVGIAIWVDKESELDAVTAISGSGPAYFFYFIELLEAAGVKLGLPQESAARLARQTALGAASMALDEDVVTLRQQVTSRRGTTEQAILSLQRDRLDKLVENATAAAQRRALELARELTEEKA